MGLSFLTIRNRREASPLFRNAAPGYKYSDFSTCTLSPVHTTQLWSQASCRSKSVGDRNAAAVRTLYLVWLQISIIGEVRRAGCVEL